MQINGFLIVVGIIPYSIKRHRTKDEQVLSVKALFGDSSFAGRRNNAHGKSIFPSSSICGWSSLKREQCSHLSLSRNR